MPVEVKNKIENKILKSSLNELFFVREFKTGEQMHL